MTPATESGLRADTAMAASVLLLGAFLCFAGFGLLERWRSSPARPQPGLDDLLGAAAVTTGLVIVLWWGLSVTLAGAAAVLERCGRKHAAARAGRFCPAFMRRLAVAAFSVQMMSAPLAHAAIPAGPAAGPAWVPPNEVVVQAAWVPSAASPQAPGVGDPEPPVPEFRPTGVSPGWRPSAPVADPGVMAAKPYRAAHGGPPAPLREVTVLAGDTLWDIASRQLGPTASDVDVALHWPRWYEANKAQIGENPHVLLPGQILKPPFRA